MSIASHELGDTNTPQNRLAMFERTWVKVKKDQDGWNAAEIDISWMDFANVELLADCGVTSCVEKIPVRFT